MNPMLNNFSPSLSSDNETKNPLKTSKKFKFACKKCDFYTNKNCNYIQHINTMKHKITPITFPAGGGGPCPILPPSNVHIPPTIIDNPVTITEVLNATADSVDTVNNTDSAVSQSRKAFVCNKCSKLYLSNKGLWQHKKNCNYIPVNEQLGHEISTKTTESSKNITPEAMSAFMMEVMKANHTHMLEVINVVVSSLKSNSTLNTNPNLIASNAYSSINLDDSLSNNQQQLIFADVNGGNVNINGNQNIVNAPTTTNSNNKTYNFNMFLKEKCKDAKNIIDFANEIELNNDDMEDVGRNGFVKGISKIFIDNLEKTDVTMRPIHCTDYKREIMAVKDQNKWQRTNIYCDVLFTAVRVLEKKNLELINKWAKKHPECENSDTQANRRYMILSKNSDGHDKNIAQVLKNVAKKSIITNDELIVLRQ
jgi:hypothetical protein